MTRIQGIPDPGPGLRLHLNENTGGCSPKVIAAVRALEAPALATYPDFREAVRETAAYLDVDADALLLTNGLDEGLLVTAVGYLTARTPPALAELGAPALAPGDVPEVIVAMPAFDPYLTTSRARCQRRAGSRLPVSPRGRARGRDARHAAHLHQQPL